MAELATLPATTLGSEVAAGDYVPTADQRLTMNGVPWSHFEVLLALRGDAPAPRMAYLDGVLELMNPSRHHERIGSLIGRLIEAFALERGIDLCPYGSWTLKQAREATGAEPDECYIIGPDQSKDKPDLVIEVAWTRGGVEKSEIYHRLGIREFWRWKQGKIEVYVLGAEGYERRGSSECFPELDIELLTSHLDHPTATAAIRAFRAALMGRAADSARSG